jgi:hypothetical protein
MEDKIMPTMFDFLSCFTSCEFGKQNIQAVKLSILAIVVLYFSVATIF